MPMFDPGTLYLDPILTDFSVGYREQTLYGLRLFPEVEVRTKSGKYRVWDRSNWQIWPSRREPGTHANEIRGGKWSSDEFKTIQHSLQAAVADEERQELTSLGGLANATFGGDFGLEPETEATALVNRSLMLEHEQKVATTMRNAANYASNHKLTLSGSSKWSDYTGGTSSTSDPVANLRTAFQRIHLDTGEWPNTLVYPFDGIGIIENHPRVVDRFKNFSLSTPDAWKVLLGFPPEATEQLNVFVVDSKYNAADNIDAAENITSFWGQDVWLGRVEDKVGKNTQTFGKTFATIQLDGSVRPTDRWREEGRKSDLVRTTWEWDTKIVSALNGYLFTNAFAAVT